jgi:hypothetical protein
MTSSPRQRLKLATVLLAAALGQACTDHTTPVEPALGLVNEVAESGNIFRFRDEFVIITRHDEAGLISITGWPGSVADLCNEVGTGDLMDFQVKPHTAGELNAMITNRDAFVQILALTPTQRLCRDLQEDPVLYRGTAFLRRTDNDFTETGTEGNRANSFGWRINGVLTSVSDAARIQYSEQVRIVINPQTGEVNEEVVRIALN